MTQQRDIERLLDQWFSDGPDQAPDRVVDIVTDRIERQSQRPAWRLQRRPFPVNAYVKLAVAAAAVMIVAVVGYNLLPGRSTEVGGRGLAQPLIGATSVCVAIRRFIAERCVSAVVHWERQRCSGRHPAGGQRDDPVLCARLLVDGPGGLGQ